MGSRRMIGVGLSFSTQTRRPEEWIIEEITTLKNGQNTTQKKRPLTPNQKRILNYLKRHPQGSREDIVTALKNISEDGVKYSIGVLKKYHGLHRKGGRRNGEWVFKN